MEDSPGGFILHFTTAQWAFACHGLEPPSPHTALRESLPSWVQLGVYRADFGPFYNPVRIGILLGTTLTFTDYPSRAPSEGQRG